VADQMVSDWKREQTQMMLRTASAIAVSLAAILASTTVAAANTFTLSQAAVLGTLSGRLSALSKDIRASMHVLAGTDDYSCLEEIHNVLESTTADLLFVYDLAILSAEMHDPTDEVSVNETLSARSTFLLNMLAEARRYALTQGAICSRSPVVNTYAQKTAALADEAAALFSGVNRKLSPR
jgi:hypothetical protein